MKRKELGECRNKRWALLWMVIAACITLAGCARLGPLSLNQAMIQYDSSVLKSEKELLLLNIIRMHDDQPPHFTVSTNIAATFGFSSTAGLNPSFSSGSNKNSLGLSLGGTASESPTITIAPMQGKDFAQRLLKPIDIAIPNSIFLQRGGQIDQLLRLIGHSFVMMDCKNPRTKDVLVKVLAEFPVDGQRRDDWCQDNPAEVREAECFKEGAKSCLLVNRPPRKSPEQSKEGQHYALFRKVVLHIKATGMSGRLQVFPLEFEQEIEGTFKTAKDLSTKDVKDTTDALEKQYRWKKISKPGKEEGFILTKSDQEIEGTFRTAKDLSTKEVIDALEKQYRWKKISKPGKEEGFILTKSYTFTALLDFDFAQMEDKDKRNLLDDVSKNLELSDYMKFDQSVVLVLLRGNKDKNIPLIYGLFRLRNFRQVLQFLGESLKDQPGYEREYDVAPFEFEKELVDPLKPTRLYNPALTLTVHSGSSDMPPPRDRVVEVGYNGESFWISSPPEQTVAQQQPQPIRWDKQVFDILYEIFQTNRIEPSVPPPLISIGK
jgi:hypothetical protein